LVDRFTGACAATQPSSPWRNGAEFSDIRALVLLNVVSGKTFIERGAEHLHLDPAKEAA
jgi:hypothetical protein